MRDRALGAYSLIKHRRQAKDRLSRSLERRLWRVWLGFGAALGLVLAVVIVAFGWVYSDVTHDLPSLQAIPLLLDPQKGFLLQPTRLYDRSGQHILLTLENPGVGRTFLSADPAKPDHISPELVKAMLVIFDPTFWSNPGFSWANLDPDQHPTIAQRLVSDLLLWQEPPSLRRSLRERLLAGQVVSTYGRQQVLDWYLNSANYGHLAYGAEAAAQAYFGKSASQLNLAESALLAAAARAPALNPLDAPEAARLGQKEVLAELAVRKQITAKELTQAVVFPLEFRLPPAGEENPAKAFSGLVLDQLARTLDRSRLERGGLRIFTTLDYDLQIQLNCTLRTQLGRLTGGASQTGCSAAGLLPTLSSSEGAYPNDLSASAVILDPSTGQVLAFAGETGSGGEAEVPAGHPPGTILTPFVYLSAFTRGSSPSTLVWDIPASLPLSEAGLQNLDGQFHGPQRLRMAFANDYLVPAVQTLGVIGPQNVWRLAEQFGLVSISSPKATGDTNVLYQGGSIGLVDIAQAYGVFANQGVLVGQAFTGSGVGRSSAVLRVEGLDGTTWLDWTAPKSQAVVSEQLAYLVNNVMSDVTARWPSLGYPNPLEIGQPAGAKLGQTLDGRDAWTVGYTPRLVVGIWMGYPAGSATETRVSGRDAAGIWHALIQYASQGLPAAGWRMPAGVTQMDVCDPSGMLPTQTCPVVVNEVFLNGNEPTGYDPLYRTLQVNRETGLLATVFTAQDMIEPRVYMIVPPEAQEWAKQQGLPVPPTDYDAIQAPLTMPDVNINAPAMFAYVHGKVELRGTASVPDLSFYRVQVGEGLNPQQWLQIGPESSQPVKDGLLVSWDTGQEGGLYAVRLMVVHQDQRVDTATIQVTVDNVPPKAQVVYPKHDQSIAAQGGLGVTLQAAASDDTQLARVEFWLDEKLVAALDAPPFAYPWKGMAGKHSLVVKAFDMAGNETDTPSMQFTLEK